MTLPALYGTATYGNTIYGNLQTGGGETGATDWTFTRDPTSPTRLPAASTQRIGWMARATVAGATVDPTSATVEYAFTTGPDPATGDWKPGTWETIPGPPRQYAARILIGPNQVADPGRGFWIVWVRVTDNPETPIRAIGTLTIT